MDELLLIKVRRALDIAEYDGSRVILDNEDEVIKAILAKAEPLIRKNERVWWLKALYEVLDKHPNNGDLIHRCFIQGVIRQALKGESND